MKHELLPELLMVGLSHRSAPVDVRERLAVAPPMATTAVVQLRDCCGAREAVLLSTCNRVEAYVVGPGGAALQERVVTVLSDRAGLPRAALEPHLKVQSGADALAHLMRVASSLDSLVVGEPQILGQVKDAFDAASAAQTVGPVLSACFPEAFRVAKRVRTETGIARNPVSVSSVAVDLARQVFGGFSGKTVLLVGAGEMADLAARSLASKGASVLVTNRTAARAAELATAIGGDWHPFDDLLGALQRADIVVSSTGAPHPILTRALIAAAQRARRGRPLLLVDIAVPRDVEPDAAQIGGVFVADVDDLEKVVAQHMESRRGEADRAEGVIADELARFLRARAGQNVAPVITALRGHVLAICHEEAERALRSLPALGERERDELRQMAERIAKKLLHAPQMALKRDAAQGGTLAAAVAELFGVQPESSGGAAAQPDAPAADLPAPAVAGK